MFCSVFNETPIHTRVALSWVMWPQQLTGWAPREWFLQDFDDLVTYTMTAIHETNSPGWSQLCEMVPPGSFTNPGGSADLEESLTNPLANWINAI